jgi:hypothetical protein
MDASQPLLFELSTPGARAVDPPVPDVPRAELDPAYANFVETGLPQLGQLDLVRHYTHLAQRNFSVDGNFYPLGSCTMKYNPRVNEWAASLAGFANLHPLQNEADCQGLLELLYNLRVFLQEISGLDEVSLQPCAGAHGEWTGLKVIRAADLVDRLTLGEDGRPRPNVQVLHLLRTRYAAWLDPSVLSALEQVVPPFAPGTKVVLSDDTPAIVIGFDARHPYQPRVRRMSDQDLQLVGEPVDLATQPSLHIRRAAGLDVEAMIPPLARAA